VRELQFRLSLYAEDGYWPPLNLDGLFGAETETRVRAVQSMAGVDADGVVGPDTWSALGVC
jgi:lysozyme